DSALINCPIIAWERGSWKDRLSGPERPVVRLVSDPILIHARFFFHDGVHVKLTRPLVLLVTGEHDHGFGGRLARISPAVLQLGRKDEVVALVQQKTLPFDFVFELALEADYELISGVQHREWAAACP